METNFIQIKRDSNGNPRYIIYWQYLMSGSMLGTDKMTVKERYEIVHKYAKTIGFRKYNSKEKGYFVTQSFNLTETVRKIREIQAQMDNDYIEHYG